MTILGAAACAKLTADRLVRDLLTYFRETTVTSPAPRPTSSRLHRNNYSLSRPMKPSLSGFPSRPSSRRTKKKVSLMTDAELRTELNTRRRRRAKERHLYSRAMQSEKLAALESDLAKLRREMHTIHPISSKPILRQRTSHSVRWQNLPRDHRPLDITSSSLSNNLPPLSLPINTTSAPPPPPPCEPAEDEVLIIDPEKRSREKEERQRRREAKRKERAQSKKPMSLADIVRSAGPNPMKCLKPATKERADFDKEEHNMHEKVGEEREKRQEKEIIELEKKNPDNMGRAIQEQISITSSSTSQEHGKSGQPDEQPPNSSASTEENQAKDSAVNSMSETASWSTAKSSHDLKESQVMKHAEPSEPTSASLPGKSSGKDMQDIATCAGVEAIGTTRTMTGECSESSEPDPERQTTIQSQGNISLPIATKEGGGGQQNQEHDEAHASGTPVTGPADNKSR